MDLPFTQEQFFDVFAAYNQSVWPAQLVLTPAAIALAFIAGSGRLNARLSLATLGVFWLWTAIAYHWFFFRDINPAAALFAVLFAVQGIAFVFFAIKHNPGALMLRTGGRGATGAALVLYALVLYPLLNFATGHHYPATPTFGLPCPTTLFTFGILLWLEPLPLKLLVIPAAWSLLGLTAALQLGVYPDLALPAAAAITFAFAWRARVTRPHTRPHFVEGARS